MATISDLQSKYIEISNGKDAIITSLINKGVSIPNDIKVKDIAPLIDGISTGFPNGQEWTKSNITNNSDFNKIKYANGIFVAISNEKSSSSDTTGGIYYSTDGKVWTQSNIRSSDWFFDICYAQGVWVVTSIGRSGGLQGGMYYSTNGKAWIPIENVSDRCYDLSYSNGIWSVNSGNDIYISNDGKIWTEVYSSPSYGINKLINFYGTIMANVGFGSGTYKMVRRVDDIFVTDDFDFGSCYGFGIENGMIIGSFKAGLYYSTIDSKGKTWFKCSGSTSIFRYIRYVNDIWLASGNDGIYYSLDGKTWAQTNITNDTFFNFECINGIKYASKSGASEYLYYSFDGITWQQIKPLPSYTYVQDVPLYSSGAFLLPTSNGVFYSADGINYTKAKGIKNDITHLTCGNGVLICCGQSDSEYSSGFCYSVVWEPKS